MRACDIEEEELLPVAFPRGIGFHAQHAEHRFGDLGREGIRLESVRVALRLLLDRIGA